MLIHFARQLSVLLDANVPVRRALWFMRQQARSHALQSALSTMAHDIEAGASLSTSMARHPCVFPSTFVSIVRANEVNGTLPLALRRHADTLARVGRFRRHALGLGLHVGAVFAVSTLLFIVLMRFVIPPFRALFADFRTTLPTLTENTLALASFFDSSTGLAFVVGALLAIISLYMFATKTARGRWLAARIALDIPFLDTLVRQGAIARFTRTLGALLVGSVPVPEALARACATTGNPVLARELEKVCQAVMAGQDFAAAVRHSSLREPALADVIEISMEGGTLGNSLLRIADQYETSINRRLDQLHSVLVPAMSIALGLGEALMVMSLFLPFTMVMGVSGGEG